MNIPAYHSTIPTDAESRPIEPHSNSDFPATEYFVGGERVGLRYFHEDGSIAAEYTFRGDRKHGWTYHFDFGELSSAEPFENGRPHGTAFQFGEGGCVIGTYTLDHGTGIDLWRQEHEGKVTLSEAHQMKDGLAHG
jgi:hypothetical protein